MIGNKLLIIGIDGANFNAIKPLTKKNELPTFKKLMDGGSWGKLESTIPPVTCPAWPSFVTGKKPKNHGAYDWFSYKKDYSRHIINSTSIRGKRYWDYLNELGLNCGVINIPYSYPPRKIEGFIISGLLSPEDKDFTYPKNLKKELIRIGYKIEPDTRSISDTKFFKDMVKTLELRKEATIRLMKSKRWDVLTVIFRAQEHVHHRFWKKNKIGFIYQIYKTLDKILDEMLKEAGEKTNVIIMSDHGFGNIPKYIVHFNTWLVKEGYLAVEKHTKLPVQKVHIFLHKFRFENLKNFVKKRVVSALDIVSRGVIWHKTKSWIRISEDTGFIFINKKGRFEHGIVGDKSYSKIREELLKKIEQLRYPKNNEKIIENIWKKEELYGDSELAPDIIFKTKPQYKGWEALGKDIFLEIPEYARIGDHSPEGIFIAFGPNIKKKKIENANLIDLAPTILAFYGIKSDDMDGQALDVIKKEIEIKRQPKVSIREDLEIHEDEVFDEKDNEKIMERLRALGYIQ